ncbi:hypothetical protein HYPSUDRAFT_181095 [Hypholoma sublateritium FD-334 SS-4]|uniref:CRAL-TRIO domain-containing protein n=1 Tax=Hypholoma sublateritium (strain FD-334 SS-4) TaxID=945553 RepID=A0A0D2PCM2_HYPSF|nr:hypothetical protein HYPSUDRAFT_181095 [Hypholoma sublateritium FD-334 SS-4]
MSNTTTTNKTTYLPLHPPPTTCKDDPHATLPDSEQKMYNEVLEYFTKSEPEYALPNEKDGKLTDDEKFWLSRECLLRYLRASKWKVVTAVQRLEATLIWRREFGIYDLVNANHVEPEAVTGKEILFGYDKTGKPAFYMIPSRQNTSDATRQIQFAVWMLERGVDLMEPGVENLALLINFGDRGKNPALTTAYAVLSILQNHYPERLGLACIINVPFLVNAFFKVVMPLVDPITRQKVKFNPEIFKDGLFTTDMAMKEWGGECNFEYKHDQYWADLVAMCNVRSKAWMENWRSLGACVGVSEWAYKTYVSDKKAEVDVEVVAVPEPDIAPPAVNATAIPDVAVVVSAAAEDVLEKVDASRSMSDGHDHSHQDQGPSATAPSGPSVSTTISAGAIAGDAVDAPSGGDAGCE